MTKLFSNKKLAYVLIGVLCALQLTQSIANWCGGGFNGGSLILCILMLGLLTLVGVGIAKKNKLLTIVSGVSILSVVIYVLTNNYSGTIKIWSEGQYPIGVLMGSVFGSIGTLLLVGSFVLMVLRVIGITKNLKTINTVFSLIATLMFLLVIIMFFATGGVSDSAFTIYVKIHHLALDFFSVFVALLIPCVWHQVEAKE